MAVHIVGSQGRVDVRISPVAHFEGHCEVRGTIAGLPPSLETQIHYARVVCQKGQSPRSGSDCLMCPRYLGWRSGPGEGLIAIACRWSDRDPVLARMTRTPAMVTLDRETRCSEADAIAQHQHPPPAGDLRR